MASPGAEEPRDLSPDRAQAALDLLAELRLRTAPHTGEARRLNTELRTQFRLKRPADAVGAWKAALAGEPSEAVVRKALLDWSLALGLHAAINLANLREVRRLIERLVPALPLLESRVGAIFAWSRRGHDVAAALAGLVGRSPVMDELRTQTWRAVFTDDVRKALALKAPHRLSVLITGEPGTGKEIVAHTIASGRGSLDPDGAEPPWVTANIAALTPNLANSDLFGHVRGAFTGSTADRSGLFAAANGGVLFLDEIGDASHDVQVRLLRTLQEGTIRPVGSDSEQRVDVRVLAATNRDLTQPREDGSVFRRDLLERLSVLRVDCPPLRERLEDLPELVRHFVAMEIDLTAWPTIAEEVLESLVTQTEGYAWVGNVRELRAATNRVIAGQPAMLPDQAGGSAAGGDLTARWGVRTLEEVKLLYTQSVLERVNGNKSEAARILGIDRNTLARYAKQMEG
ncbi:MAG: sigma-54-dependent Fis family transcriptional regulator [Planctomycetes bacterium]|nr:sigma-54-dependent Fis family transcriptional regulator [Planctomycetota bacterium]